MSEKFSDTYIFVQFKRQKNLSVVIKFFDVFINFLLFFYCFFAAFSFHKFIFLHKFIRFPKHKNSKNNCNMLSLAQLLLYNIIYYANKQEENNE